MKNLFTCLFLIPLTFAIGSHQLHADFTTVGNAGYIVTSPEIISEVEAAWTIPSVAGDHSACLISILLKDREKSVLNRIGTEQRYSVNKKQTNRAFYEIHESGEAVFIDNFTLDIGDEIAAKISFQQTTHTYHLEIENKTTGQKVNLENTGVPAVKKAAWFVSAEKKDGDFIKLSKFDDIHFEDCRCVIAGLTGSISHPHGISEQVDMVNEDDISLAFTGELHNKGKTFKVVREKK